MSWPEMMQGLERLGSLGLLGVVIWLGFRFLDKHGTNFSNTLTRIQEALVKHAEEDAERHQKLIEALSATEKVSTDDVKKEIENFRTEMRAAMNALRDARAFISRMSPPAMPAVKDSRRER